jgi:multidrug efflux pump subunit AcrA (membrane-fusion protein)
LAAIDLEDELTIQESHWRGRLITGAMILGLAGAVAAGLYAFVFSGSSASTTRETEDIKVERKTINQTLIISGVADAQFNSNLIFQASGKVATVNVKVGDAVKQGDVLASLESDDLSNNVQTAQANFRTAQLKLEDLLDGATDAELAAADQAVAAAEASVVKAKNDLQDLLDGASAAELAAADSGGERGGGAAWRRRSRIARSWTMPERCRRRRGGVVRRFGAVGVDGGAQQRCYRAECRGHGYSTA